MAFAEDIDLFLRDFGVTCSHDGTEFPAIYDQPGSQTDLGGVAIVVTERSILYNPATLTLDADDTVNVDGTDYRVSSDTAEPPDGKLRRAILKRLT